MGLAEVGGPCLLGMSMLGLDDFSYSSLQRRWTEVGCKLVVPLGWVSAIFCAIKTGVGMDPGGWYDEAWPSVDPKLLSRGKLSIGSCLGFISMWLPGGGNIF